MPRILIRGNKALAARWVGWAKQKARFLPDTVDKLYAVPGVTIHLRKLRGTISSLEIVAAGGYGYQFTVPYDFVSFPSDKRFLQTFFKYRLGTFKSPTLAGVSYVRELEDDNFELLTSEAYGKAPTDGSLFYNTWWGEGTQSVSVSTPQKRYGSGEMGWIAFYAEPLFLGAAPAIHKPTGSSRPIVIDEASIRTSAIAGAKVKFTDGTGSALVFVLWDSTQNGPYFAVKQPNGAYSFSAFSLPSWAYSEAGGPTPHGHYVFNREGTKMAANLAAYRTYTSGNGTNVRPITGIVEWDIELIVNEEGTTYTPSINSLLQEYDETGFKRYLAIDYQWDDEDGDSLVKVEVDAYLETDWTTATLDPDQEYGYKMIAAYASWYKKSAGPWEAPYRVEQCFHGPFLQRHRELVGEEWVTIREGMTTSGMFAGTGGWTFSGLAGWDIEAAALIHLANHGYMFKISNIAALDLRADAVVITNGAKLSTSTTTSFVVDEYPRDYAFSCFGELGYGIVGTTAPGPYTGGAGYPLLNAAHPDAGTANIHVQETVQENTPCMTSLFNTVYDTMAFDQFENPACDFFSIHPAGHWAGYAQMPRVVMFGTQRRLRNGQIDFAANERMFDIIRVKKSDGSYNETSHMAGLVSVWGSAEPAESGEGSNIDSYAAMAAAGFWAV